ncbi:hypothetical protein PAL_GLEAN10024762 [Pteropus alecto]|uniref:Uncharacterized protein n=1 Tax=Pteropus alecto TaxID=9402 RepID=L5JZD9_PTEAL|nr:hypothetical protein PAL_GLEAN10024762 [Pteropus alecto]
MDAQVEAAEWKVHKEAETHAGVSRMTTDGIADHREETAGRQHSIFRLRSGKARVRRGTGGEGDIVQKCKGTGPASTDPTELSPAPVAAHQPRAPHHGPL